MVMTTVAIGVLGNARPGFQYRGWTAGFGTQGNLKPLLEEERVIKNSETIPSILHVFPVKRQKRRLKNPQRIVGAEEGGDIHVNARFWLVVEIISDVDVLGRWAGPNVHLLAVKTTGARRVKDHALAIRVRVERKIFPIEIVARAIIGTELMSLHAGPQKRQRINPESAGFDRVCFFAGKRGLYRQDRQT